MGVSFVWEIAAFGLLLLGNAWDASASPVRLDIARIVWMVFSVGMPMGVAVVGASLRSKGPGGAGLPLVALLAAVAVLAATAPAVLPGSGTGVGAPGEPPRESWRLWRTPGLVEPGC